VSAAIEILTAGAEPPTGMSDDDTDDAIDDAPDVDPEEVRHVASLARIDLDESEVEQFTERFADVLAAFEALDEVPEVEREEELANVMRPDEVEESLSQDEALSNAPETEDGYFKGPRVS